MDRLRDELWSVMEPTYAQILRHPFVAGLTDGSLPTASFAYYIGQDARYLIDYARALAMVAATAPDAATVAMFAGDARVAIEVESQLHAGLAAELAKRHPNELAAPVSPTTLAYTSYLLRVCAQGDFAQGLAAVLPCYWIYAEVGAALLTKSSPDPLYARWIDTYGGEQFAAATEAVLEAVDAAGGWAGAAQLSAMREHVAITAKYEWMFWDAGWRREAWPI
jgi:thiaminase/transcriptional activator TenA